MQINLVVGLAFGDESKGVTVNALCNDWKNTIVVRFNGGQQCGHTVHYQGVRHVFSNFGSGTLKGVPTYWSEYCTVDPSAVLSEGNALREQGIEPMIYYNANAMVTTPYDILSNTVDSINKSHGTVGVGFGKTIQRNEDHYHLFVRDLKFPKIRDEKLRLIADNYYKFQSKASANPVFAEMLNASVDRFKVACDDLVERYKIVDDFYRILNYDKNLVFEGGQGILLDQDFGFFPHVTRSYSTSRNAFEMIDKHKLNRHNVTTYYVTRAYQTRHGNGYMSNEDKDNAYIKINPDETNIDTGAQGIFRRTMLDLDLLDYAVNCDRYYNNGLKTKLVMTCLDHVDVNNIPVTVDNEVKTMTPSQIAHHLGCFKVYCGASDNGLQIQI